MGTDPHNQIQADTSAGVKGQKPPRCWASATGHEARRAQRNKHLGAFFQLTRSKRSGWNRRSIAPHVRATASSADGTPKFVSCDCPVYSDGYWGRCTFCRRLRHVKMPVYQFAIKWADDQSPDMRYLHLADEDAARRYAKLLIQELAPSGFYSSRSCTLEVKDESGPLFSMPFRQTAD